MVTSIVDINLSAVAWNESRNLAEKFLQKFFW